MTAPKISKAAQGTIGVIMRLALVICLRVSTQKQLFTFSNIVLCHLVLSRCLSSSLSVSPSLYRFLTSFSGTRSRRLLALFLLITKAFPLSHASFSPACLKSFFFFLLVPFLSSAAFAAAFFYRLSRPAAHFLHLTSSPWLHRIHVRKRGLHSGICLLINLFNHPSGFQPSGLQLSAIHISS